MLIIAVRAVSSSGAGADECAGVLSCLDGYMNIALEQTEEHVDGAVTNRYGDAFIRGNNGGCSLSIRESQALIGCSAVYFCSGGAIALVP